MTTASDETPAGEMPVLVIAGPTASGKSGMALAAAEAFGGSVINADSMQVYRELHIITARPSDADEARAPHLLYGDVTAAEGCSVGDWLARAVEAIGATRDAGRLPIVVGGTGMYLKALLEGLAPVPQIPDEVRETVANEYDELGGTAFRAELARVDPETAARLPENDRQRLTRAMEVHRATGRPLGDWLADGNAPALAGARYHTLLIEPARDALYAAIDGRFEAMVEAGALDEVKALLALGLDPSLPAMKAVGVRELGAHLAGETSLADTIAKAQQASRNYAKRQMTWFRNQFRADFRLSTQFSESQNDEFFAFIRRFWLTGQA